MDRDSWSRQQRPDQEAASVEKACAILGSAAQKDDTAKMRSAVKLGIIWAR
jgi:hypothetical protein